MNILLLGSGGREHALAWKITQSKKVKQLYIAPGNPGTAHCGKNIPIGVSDFPALKEFCIHNRIDMLVVGPEQPLVDGIYNYFKEDLQTQSMIIIGPSKQGAELEGSKDFAKAFMLKHQIPTAKYRTFTSDTLSEGISFLKELKAPYVLKADGLAAGKGVIISENRDEAIFELTAMLKENKFGAASKKVVIEEFLNGIELSVFVLTDGKQYKILPAAKDYKRIGEGDTGLNTGGMGSVSPVPFADAAFMNKVENRIIKPTVEGLQQENIDYKGFIFIGLMNVQGDPYVIEYNVRMGDPETESVIPLIESDIVDLFESIGSETLHTQNLKVSNEMAVTIILAAKGYPEDYPKEQEIRGIEQIADSLVFHAGTKQTENGKLVSNGGRVLAVTSLGNSIEEALQKSYNAIKKIEWEGIYFRKDIGKDLL